MSQKIDHYVVRQGTHHGEVRHGHIHDDNNQSAAMIRSGPDGGRHYINMDSTGSKESGRKGSTTVKCPGTFNVLSGQDVASENFGVFIEAENGDIRIRAPHGRIVLEAENIELIANGSGTEKGVIQLDAKEKVIVTAPMISVDSKVSTKIFSEKTVEVIGKGILNIYGGLIDSADGATSNFGSKRVDPPIPPAQVGGAIGVVAGAAGAVAGAAGAVGSVAGAAGAVAGAAGAVGSVAGAAGAVAGAAGAVGSVAGAAGAVAGAAGAVGSIAGTVAGVANAASAVAGAVSALTGSSNPAAAANAISSALGTFASAVGAVADPIELVNESRHRPAVQKPPLDPEAEAAEAAELAAEENALADVAADQNPDAASNTVDQEFGTSAEAQTLLDGGTVNGVSFEIF